MTRMRSVEGKGGSVRAVTVSVAVLGLFFLAVAEPTGSIAGIVYDAATRTPLAGASVVVLNTELGAAGDADGRFFVTDIPAGTYSVEASMIGYQPQVRTIVEVSPSHTTELAFQLALSRIELAEVSVRAEYFPKVKDAPVSERNFAAEEIEAAPGGLGDIQRVVQAMPAVVSSGDQDNEIIVRGGNPNENLFMVDGIEVPYPNHFGNFTTQGGPINLLNPLLVREVDFVAGAFPARFGTRSASVMDISLKRGSLNELDGNVDLSMAGVGAVLEFPLPGNNNSFIGSYHRSFLELMAETGVWGLTAVPEYDNAIGKVTLKPHPAHDLSLVGIWGRDYIHLEPGEDVVETDYTGDQSTSRYAAGIGWQALFGDVGYGKLLLSTAATTWDLFVWEEDETDTLARNLTTDRVTTARYDASLRWAPGQETQAGVAFSLVPFDISYKAKDDTVYRYTYGPDSTSIIDSTPLLDPRGSPYVIGTNTARHEDATRLAGYMQHRLELGRVGYLTLGLRADRFDYNGALDISPRAGFSTRPLVAGLSFHAGWGWHHQTPDWYILLLDSANNSLRSRRSDHYVLGVERQFGSYLKLSLEAYTKDNNFMSFPEHWMTPDSFDYSNVYVDSGAGNAHGIELFLQKKHAHNWNGTVAYSLSRSTHNNPRDPDVVLPTDYDYGHVLTMSGMYRFEFYKQRWYRNLPSWFRATIGGIAFGDESDIGARFRYMGGRPYTPMTWDRETRRWVENTELHNSERYPAYSRLDIHWGHKFIFNRWSLAWYVEIQNALNRENVWFYNYQAGKPEPETVHQLELWPIGGLVIEF